MTNQRERCKICLCIFKENRLLRIHVTTAFFDREAKKLSPKGFSIFKIAMDTKKNLDNKEYQKKQVENSDPVSKYGVSATKMRGRSLFPSHGLTISGNGVRQIRNTNTLTSTTN